MDTGVRTHKIMNMPYKPPVDSYSFHYQEYGICEIRLTGNFSHELAQHIISHLRDYISQHVQPTAILLNAHLGTSPSIIRLTSLVDALSSINVPVAVVLRTHNEKQLADLLHNTLTSRENTAYFTDSAAALTFLRDSIG